MCLCSKDQWTCVAPSQAAIKSYTDALAPCISYAANKKGLNVGVLAHLDPAGVSGGVESLPRGSVA